MMRGTDRAYVQATPLLALLDADANAVLVHRGRALGDYPSIERVLSELDRLNAAQRAGAGSELSG